MRTADLKPEDIFKMAGVLTLSSEHVECVKIGLELLELFPIEDDDVKEIVRTLGLCDEFTLFAVWDMRNWENGNAEIFELAKKVHGWGRIHAVRELKPETDEIKHWLLTEGTVNDVINAYSSLTCWHKSDAKKILFEEPTPEEYRGIATLIEGLLDEGPVAGISALKDAETIMRRFLEITPNYELDESDRAVVSTVKEKLQPQVE